MPLNTLADVLTSGYCNESINSLFHKSLNIKTWVREGCVPHNSYSLVITIEDEAPTKSYKERNRGRGSYDL